MRKELAFYKLLIDNAPDEALEEAGIDRDIPITHWGWYYPQSNFIQVEPVKKISISSVLKGMAKLIHAYERKQFEAKYYYKTCQHCSFLSICDAAQEDSWG